MVGSGVMRQVAAGLVGALVAGGCGGSHSDGDSVDPCFALDARMQACNLVWTQPGGLCALDGGPCYAKCALGATCDEIEGGNFTMDTLLCFAVCEPTQECADGSGTIRRSWACDFEEDCLDGSDEVGCVHHVCPDGTPVPDADLCDGRLDCADGSDEWGDC
jgi:hypothetical protein